MLVFFGGVPVLFVLHCIHIVSDFDNPGSRRSAFLRLLGDRPGTAGFCCGDDRKSALVASEVRILFCEHAAVLAYACTHLHLWLEASRCQAFIVFLKR